jgi:hypothetical protein
MAQFKLKACIDPFTIKPARTRAMMKIPVIYVNGQRGIVDAEELDMLIKARKIISFSRTSGWVRVAFDLLRGDGGAYYSGPDRRNFWMYQQLSKLRYIFTTNEVNRYKPHQNFMNRLFRSNNH